MVAMRPVSRHADLCSDRRGRQPHGAARELGSSLPAVVRPRRLRALTWACACSTARPGGITLTDEGRQHLERSRHVLSALEEARSAAPRRRSRGARGPAADHGAGAVRRRCTSRRWSARFVQRHPGMQCTMLLLTGSVNLLEEGVDLGHPHRPAGRLLAGGAAAR